MPWFLLIVRWLNRSILGLGWLLPLLVARVVSVNVYCKRTSFSKTSRYSTLAPLVIRSRKPMAHWMILVQMNNALLWDVSKSVHLAIRPTSRVTNDTRLGYCIYPNLVWFALPFIRMVLSWCDLLCRSLQVIDDGLLFPSHRLKKVRLFNLGFLLHLQFQVR